MASFPETEAVLLEAQKLEKSAEENCAKVLAYLRENGVYQEIAGIREDEKRHQEIVKELIKILRS